MGSEMCIRDRSYLDRDLSYLDCDLFDLDRDLSDLDRDLSDLDRNLSDLSVRSVQHVKGGFGRFTHARLSGYPLGYGLPYTTVYITLAPPGPIFHGRYLHSSGSNSVGAKEVGVRSISPRASRRRTVR